MQDALAYYALLCFTLLYSALLCCTLLYSGVLCFTLPYSALLCFTLLYSAFFLDFFQLPSAVGMQDAFAYYGGLLFFFGLYFGVLSRDCSEMCAVSSMASDTSSLRPHTLVA